MKPANIFFDASGSAYLGDLGLTKTVFARTGQALTKIGSPAPGTPRYMAPEMLAGKPADGRADQFALAVLLYECLTGKSPFAGDTPWDVKRSQVQTPLIPVHDWNATLPRTLHAVLARALALDPQGRFPSCHQFVAGICTLLPMTQPTSSNPASWSLHDELVPNAATVMPPALTPAATQPPVLMPGDILVQPEHVAAWPTSYPVYVPQPTYLAPPPGRLGRWCRGTLLFLIGITIGSLFLPGTPLHRQLAEPAAQWLEENAGWTLPWVAARKEAEKKEADRKEPEKVAKADGPAVDRVVVREDGERFKAMRADLLRVQDLLDREKERVAAIDETLAKEKERAGLLEGALEKEKARLASIEGTLDKEARARRDAEARLTDLAADAEKWKRQADDAALARARAEKDAEQFQRKLLDLGNRMDVAGRGPYRSIPFTYKTALRRDDPRDPVRGYACKPVEVFLTAGRTYVIDMVSNDFDTYLRLVGPTGVEVAYDDDSGEGLNARLEYRAPVTGVYRIFCTSYRDVYGTFTLQAKER